VLPIKHICKDSDGIILKSLQGVKKFQSFMRPNHSAEWQKNKVSLVINWKLQMLEAYDVILETK
jgi:hypothetical protein